MKEPPGELPALLCLTDYGGDWDRYIEKVFSVFYRDFIESQPKFLNRWVRCRRDPICRGKEAGFWHCVSEGPTENDRTPDLRRCERIGWVRFAIEHVGRAGVDHWTNTRHGETRHLIWLREEFLVILAERSRASDGFAYLQLITAYCTADEHRKRKIRKERDGTRNG